MKYVPPAAPFSRNVNVSSRHPLIEFAWLLAACAVFFGAIYGLLAVSVDLALKHMPRDYEQTIASRLTRQLAEPAAEPYQQFAQRLLADMVEGQSDLQAVEITVLESPEVNAMAAPGDQVFFYRGLIDQAESENEVAMVLGHELGHVRGRDALRALGRRLVLSVSAALLFGSDSSANSFLLRGAELSEQRYSRSQESTADKIGLNLLVKRYGHAGGASDFFQRQQATHNSAAKLGWLSSHPSDDARVDAINRWINANNIPVNATAALPAFVRASD